MVRRVEVQPDDVAHFLDEERIGGQLEGLRQVRLDPEQSEPALYRALANALGSPQGACAPVRGGVGRLLQCTVDHRRHLVVVIGPGPTGSEFVVQVLDTGCSEAPSPLADGLWCDAEAEGDRRVGQAFGAGENHACPLDQGVGQGGRPGNSVELILLLVGEREWYQWASEWHGSLPCLKPAAYDTHFRDCTLGGLVESRPELRTELGMAAPGGHGIHWRQGGYPKLAVSAPNSTPRPGSVPRQRRMPALPARRGRALKHQIVEPVSRRSLLVQPPPSAKAASAPCSRPSVSATNCGTTSDGHTSADGSSRSLPIFIYSHRHP